MLTFPAITALCAGLLGVLGAVLAFHVGSYRGKSKVGIGHADDAELYCRMRKQGNFTEYVPLTLIVLGMLEMSGAAGSMTIMIMGGLLVISRVLHPMGLKSDGSPTMFRLVGMLGTLPVMLVASIWLIVNYVSSM